MKEILESQNTIMISNLSKDGYPQISYSPYVMVEDRIYIYISQVADHYEELEKNGNVSLMVIKDESSCKNLFGRQRVSFKGNAKKVENVDASIKQRFEEIHGDQMMGVLYKMDFDFFEIKIESGRLVKGFGQAYDLKYNNGEWEKEHVVVDKGNGTHGRN